MTPVIFDGVTPRPTPGIVRMPATAAGVTALVRACSPPALRRLGPAEVEYEVVLPGRQAVRR